MQPSLIWHTMGLHMETGEQAETLPGDAACAALVAKLGLSDEQRALTAMLVTQLEAQLERVRRERATLAVGFGFWRVVFVAQGIAAPG